MLSIQIGRLKLALQFSMGLNMIQQQESITMTVVPYVLPTLYIAHMIVTKVSICEWANGPFNNEDVKVV